MKIYNNTYRKLNDSETEILVTKNNDPTFLKSCIVDTEDIDKIGLIRLGVEGYFVQAKRGARQVSHIVLNHESNLKTVVDHINGDISDNRKKNLRVLTQAQNANNRHYNPKNNTGVYGIAERNNGGYNYFRASVTDIREPVTKRGSRKRYCKQFNIKKLGREKAMSLAKEWLSDKRKEFGYINNER